MEPLKLVVAIRTECPECGGKGYIISYRPDEPCYLCNGEGSISKPVEDQAAGLEAFKQAASLKGGQTQQTPEIEQFKQEMNDAARHLRNVYPKEGVFGLRDTPDEASLRKRFEHMHSTQEERAKYIAAVDSLIGTSVKFKLNPPKLANIEETTGRKPDFFIVSVVPVMWNLHPYVRAYPGSTEAMKFHGNKARELVAASRVLNPSVKFNCIVRVYLK